MVLALHVMVIDKEGPYTIKTNKINSTTCCRNCQTIMVCSVNRAPFISVLDVGEDVAQATAQATAQAVAQAVAQVTAQATAQATA